MTPKTPGDVTQSAVTAAWGVATLVLLFLVMLLGYELYQRSEDAAEAVALDPGFVHTESAPAAEPAGTEVPVRLYFGSPYSTGLRTEQRRISLTDDLVLNCKAAFEALAAGPRSDAVPVISAAARVRAIYVMNQGDLVVDLARDTDAPQLHSASAELLMIRALTMTLSQSALRVGNAPAIKRVRFLFEGAPTGSHFPAHIKVDYPVEPDSTWVVPAKTGAGNG